MKAQYLIGPAILTAMAMSGTVLARAISVDSGDYGNFDSSQPQNGGTLFSSTGQTYSVDGLLLSFSPGTAMVTGAMFSPNEGTTADYCLDTGCSTAITNGAMFNWGPQPGSQVAGPTGLVEQVIVYNLADGQSLPLVGAPNQSFTTSGAFEVDFNYAATTASGCSGETAMINVGGQKYMSTNPCVAVDNAFFFNDSGGKLTLEGTPSGWTAVGGTVSAPEIDANSAVAGLSLMFGGLAVLLGRRRSPRVGNSAA
jgi:hypothetical protein